MRPKFYAALILALVFTGCNAIDQKLEQHANNNSQKPQPGPETTYADGARRVTTTELDSLLKDGKAVVIDVRNQQMYDAGHIPGSKLIPAADITNHLSELPRNKMIITYCS